MSEEIEQVTKSGVSRRDMLRRGAIVGGALWVSPVIQSLTNAAYGQAPSNPQNHFCCSCGPAGSAVCHADGNTNTEGLSPAACEQHCLTSHGTTIWQHCSCVGPCTAAACGPATGNRCVGYGNCVGTA
jgi:hypothetical protein